MSKLLKFDFLLFEFKIIQGIIFQQIYLKSMFLYTFAESLNINYLEYNKVSSEEFCSLKVYILITNKM